MPEPAPNKKWECRFRRGKYPPGISSPRQIPSGNFQGFPVISRTCPQRPKMKLIYSVLDSRGFPGKFGKFRAVETKAKDYFLKVLGISGNSIQWHKMTVI